MVTKWLLKLLDDPPRLVHITITTFTHRAVFIISHHINSSYNSPICIAICGTHLTTKLTLYPILYSCHLNITAF